MNVVRFRPSALSRFVNVISGEYFSLQSRSSQVSNVFARHLYSKSTLGIDNFVDQRERIQHQMDNIEEKFKQKMTEYVKDDSKNMIFTEDLKNVAFLAKTDDDINLTVAMLKRFNQQNKELRFGNFIFGPVIMRLFHLYNKADLAFACFKDESLEGVFDQLISYQILMDLLYENEKYDEVLETFEIVKNRQIESIKYPRNMVVLANAACYKLNSEKSFEFALNLWKELQNVGHYPMRRATTFFAGLAFNQKKPEIALEVLSAAKNQNYTTVRNLKVASLAAIGRTEDAVEVLKTFLSEDLATPSLHTFNREILNHVEEAVNKTDNMDVKLEFKRIFELLQKQNQITDEPLDKQLCSEISITRTTTSPKFSHIQRQHADRQPNKFYNFRQRPGLNDLV